MNDIAVRVEGLGKRFSLKAMAESTLYGTLSERMRAVRGHLFGRRASGSDAAELTAAPHGVEEFWAVKDISFELKYGEVLGIIGQNGAGKSTLLKILAQVLPPTTGRAELYGRVGALLEVGTGFNAELSGRENIFLYGSILGMSRADIAAHFDEIVEFAEVGQFLDQPIKHYSSGMHSRLGFSVAAHLQCNILLVDEVLAVGDAAFRAKCLGKMQDVTSQGRAVIFVSHNMSAVNNMCTSAIVLSHGQIEYQGPTSEATAHYMKGVFANTGKTASNPTMLEVDNSKELSICEIFIKDSRGNYKSHIEYVEDFIIGMKVRVQSTSRDYYNAIWLQDSTGNILVFSTDEDLGESLIAGKPPGIYEFTARFPGRLFKPDTYNVICAACRRQKGQIDRHDNLIPLTISDTQTWRAQRGLYRRHAAVAPELEWTVTRVDSKVGQAADKLPLRENAE